MFVLVCNINGIYLVYDYAEKFMDDDLREELHNELGPCSRQDFFTAYEYKHLDKFGALWEFSKHNFKI